MNTKQQEQAWTGNINFHVHIEEILAQLVDIFNQSPYFKHSGMTMRLVDQQIEAYIPMQDFMVGNRNFHILHGGATATVLDSIGGLVAMAELYKRANAETIEHAAKQVSRLATMDMRVDYLAPGHGEYFIARAEALRMGKKTCTMRMNLVNNQEKLIATAIASYSY